MGNILEEKTKSDIKKTKQLFWTVDIGVAHVGLYLFTYPGVILTTQDKSQDNCETTLWCLKQTKHGRHLSVHSHHKRRQGAKDAVNSISPRTNILCCEFCLILHHSRRKMFAVCVSLLTQYLLGFWCERTFISQWLVCVSICMWFSA